MGEINDRKVEALTREVEAVTQRLTKAAKKKGTMIVAVDNVEDSGKGSRPLGAAISDRDGEAVLGLNLAAEGGLLDSLKILGIPDADPARLALFFAPPHDEFGFDTYRTRPDDQPNATFSEDAMFTLRNNVIQWVMARIYNRWMMTMEPPKFLRLVVKIEWEK